MKFICKCFVHFDASFSFFSLFISKLIRWEMLSYLFEMPNIFVKTNHEFKSSMQILLCICVMYIHTFYRSWHSVFMFWISLLCEFSQKQNKKIPPQEMCLFPCVFHRTFVHSETTKIITYSDTHAIIYADNSIMHSN